MMDINIVFCVLSSEIIYLKFDVINSLIVLFFLNILRILKVFFIKKCI